MEVQDTDIAKHFGTSGASGTNSALGTLHTLHASPTLVNVAINPNHQSDSADILCIMNMLSHIRRAVKLPVSQTTHPCRTQARRLHLAPPWLLDDYIPRYQLISSVEAAKKRSLAYAHLRECNLCPRKCGVNRYEKTGVCLIGAEKVKVNTIGKTCSTLAGDHSISASC